ncbi:MAG TPA: hypothetical protein VM509_09460 [Planctomycetota bacterium]|nr:hypothetical protein [Planctomycetota bacterium]
MERQQEEGLGQVLNGAPPRAESQRSVQRGGPYWLLLPLLSAAAAVWWIRHPTIAVVPSRPPLRVDPDSTHDVLGGEMALGGGTLAFWLAPSEPDPARQAFQAQALRRRYALPDGEPWRLRLEWRAEDGSAAQDARLDVARLSVVDAGGTALTPLMLGRELDPLATLLRPPVSPLTVGNALDLFLWGRAPASDARLSGIGAAPAEAGSDVSLTPRPLRIGELVGPMARLDPPLPGSSAKADGKRAGAKASALPVQGSNDARY